MVLETSFKKAICLPESFDTVTTIKVFDGASSDEYVINVYSMSASKFRLITQAKRELNIW